MSPRTTSFSCVNLYLFICAFLFVCLLAFCLFVSWLADKVKQSCQHGFHKIFKDKIALSPHHTSTSVSQGA